MSTTMLDAFLKAGFKAPKERKARPMKVQKCHRCGAPMELIEGTNVLICTGDVDVTDPETGNPTTVSCNHRHLFSK